MDFKEAAAIVDAVTIISTDGIWFRVKCTRCPEVLEARTVDGTRDKLLNHIQRHGHDKQVKKQRWDVS